MSNEVFVTLTWHPLQELAKLTDVDRIHADNNRAGLYIWGFMDDNKKFWPYYVGKHRNVPFRLCEHLSNLKGGNYVIYGNHDLFSLADKKFYHPYNLPDKILFIQDKYKDDQIEHVQNMINRFYFTYCIMDKFYEFGNSAEKTVLNCFSRQILMNTIFGEKSKSVDIGNLFDVIDPFWDNRDGDFDKRFQKDSFA